ncbi:hypothetical protein NFI96_022208, partial [Prochilodus magdalenae]
MCIIICICVSLMCSEFERIAAVNLKRQFRCALDMYASKLLKLYRMRRQAFGENMQKLLNELDEQTTDDDQKYTEDVKVAILTVLEDDGGALCSLPDVISLTIVLEENVIVEGTDDLPSAFLLLYGLFNALNI